LANGNPSELAGHRVPAFAEFRVELRRTRVDRRVEIGY
jgi:hypothetical protein